jgi:hypothetical protein
VLFGLLGGEQDTLSDATRILNNLITRPETALLVGLPGYADLDAIQQKLHSQW